MLDDIDIREVIDDVRQEVGRMRQGMWDFKKDDPVPYFDRSKSYELTGYRPIDGKNGLDFNPDWFRGACLTFLRTGHYCQSLFKSKQYNEFFKEEYRRCRDGYTVNGYTITGDHYFFLNYYRLPDLKSAKKAGGGRETVFPAFYVYQYEYFHYLELCKRTLMNSLLMKARGVGFSEILASTLTCAYEVVKGSNTLLTASTDDYVGKTLEKIWKAIDRLNAESDLGFSKLSQVVHTQTKRRASKMEKINGQMVETGSMSQITGIVADNARKIRGDRTDILCLEEAGSNKEFKKSFIQGSQLVENDSEKWGIIMAGGTGGDIGPMLEGLKDAYYNPSTYKALPYRHRFTQDGQEILSGYFIPAHVAVTTGECMDARGWCDPDRGMEHCMRERARRSGDTEALLLYCAERCVNAEEAFRLEGDNKFNKVIIADQIAKIRMKRDGYFPPERGYMSYVFDGQGNDYRNITGCRWIPGNGGKILMYEHPVWTDEYVSQCGDRKMDTNKYVEMDDLYIAGVDGIDIGQRDTSKNTKDPSEFCLVIKRRAFGTMPPQYVCVYKDRPDNINEAYKTAMCLLDYYNARVNIEATRVGFLNWARTHHCAHRFMSRPRAALADKIGGRTRLVGTQATKLVIQMYTDLIVDYIDDYGHTVWFEEMLDQLATYSYANKTKFDIVAAMGMCEMADQELSGRAPMQVEAVTRPKTFRIGYYYDERGIKRYGKIPDGQGGGQASFNLGRGAYSDPTRNETSDPRLDRANAVLSVRR